MNKFKFPVALASLEHPNFRVFWTVQLISLIGIWMQITAQGWLVYELTSSKFLLGSDQCRRRTSDIIVKPIRRHSLPIVSTERNFWYSLKSLFRPVPF